MKIMLFMFFNRICPNHKTRSLGESGRNQSAVDWRRRWNPFTFIPKALYPFLYRSLTSLRDILLLIY